MKFYLALFLIIVSSFVPSLSFAQEPQPLFLDVAQKTIDVTTGFEGADVIVFGIKGASGDLAILISGPEKRIVLRKKEKVSGLWMNRSSMDFRHVPLFYDYAVSRNEEDIASPEMLKNLNIGLNYLTFDPDTDKSAEDISMFQDALIRTQQQRGLFSLKPKSISFIGAELFRTNFYLPKNIPMGQYKIEAILLDNGKVIARQDMPITVRPKGLAAMILMYATNFSFAYALTCLIIAVVAGFAGFFLLRKDV